jgi:pilus assembly protein FimV
VTTKLELAQAYEEMGDKEGAKELFQEVLAEGNSTQKATAAEKLATLG